MDESQVRYLIREEINKALNVILHGVTGNSTKETEDIEQLFPDMPTITSRPVMHPYGLVSRAPKGTISVVARIGEHFGNRQVIGHRDKDRPDLESGEVVLYDENGHRIQLKKDKIQIGSGSSSNPLCLGDETKKALSDILQALIAHTHVTSAPGAPTSPPINAAQFTAVKASPVDDEKMLSDLVFTEKG